MEQDSDPKSGPYPEICYKLLLLAGLWSPLEGRYTHKTSGFIMSSFKMSGFKTSGMSSLQKVKTFSKRPVSQKYNITTKLRINAQHKDEIKNRKITKIFWQAGLGDNLVGPGGHYLVKVFTSMSMKDLGSSLAQSMTIRVLWVSCRWWDFPEYGCHWPARFCQQPANPYAVSSPPTSPESFLSPWNTFISMDVLKPDVLKLDVLQSDVM